MSVLDCFVVEALLACRDQGSCCDTLPVGVWLNPCLSRCACKATTEPGFPAPPGTPWYKYLASPWCLNAFSGVLLQELVFVL